MARTVDVSLLRAFVAVVDAGGMTAATGVLNLTQAAVSQQIKRLEETLGEELITRDRRGMKLTTAGERLFEQAAHVRRAAQAREDRVDGLHRLLGLPPAFGSDGDPVVARGDMTDPGEMPGCIAREVRQAASGRCNAHAGEQHSGQPHIRCEAPASGGLGGSVEPFEGLADQAALGGEPS